MELVTEMTIKSSKGNNEKIELFQKIEGAVFCTSCGKQYKENEILKNGNKCTICNNDNFLKGNFAETLAGYIRLDKLGKLKEYYKNRTRKISGARMNTRRMIIWLAVKDGFMLPNDRKIEYAIYRCLWKRW